MRYKILVILTIVLVIGSCVSAVGALVVSDDIVEKNDSCSIYIGLSDVERKVLEWNMEDVGVWVNNILDVKYDRLEEEYIRETFLNGLNEKDMEDLKELVGDKLFLDIEGMDKNLKDFIIGRSKLMSVVESNSMEVD